MDSSNGVVTRRMSPEGLDALKKREGLRLLAYDDARPDYALTVHDTIIGTLTNGYGHTGRDVYIGQVITEAQAEAWLRDGVAWFEGEVDRVVEVPLTQPQFDALVSAWYNIGPGIPGQRDGLTVLRNGQTSTLLRKLNAGDYASVPGELLKWVNDGRGRNAGLVNRRNSEGGQFVRGAFVASANVAALPAPEPLHKQPEVIGGATGTVGGTLIAASQQVQAVAGESKWLTLAGVALLVAGALIGAWAVWRRAKAAQP